jgi:hypothetical protein
METKLKNDSMIINDEFGRIWEEVAMAYFDVYVWRQ